MWARFSRTNLIRVKKSSKSHNNLMKIPNQITMRKFSQMKRDYLMTQTKKSEICWKIHYSEKQEWWWKNISLKILNLSKSASMNFLTYTSHTLKCWANCIYLLLFGRFSRIMLSLSWKLLKISNKLRVKRVYYMLRR